MTKEATFSNADWRMIQALQDIQEALSALTFFMDVPESISEIERRKFRCYHDMMAISYWRPFSQSKGLPKLSWAALGISPTPEEKELHERISVYRNKLVAHTDMEKMRVKVKALVVSDRSEDFPRYPIIVKDVGFEFLNDQMTLESWLWKLRSALTERTFKIVQSMPPDQSFTIDYLA